MSLLKDLKTADDVSEEKDTLGGGRFGVVPTGIYPFGISAAYMTKSAGGAIALNLDLLIKDGTREPGSEQLVRQQLWIASGDKKGNLTYYERDGKKHSLPGYSLADQLCQLTLNKSIGDMETELRAIKLYSHEAQAEVTTEVEMVVDLLGTHVYGAIELQLQDKSDKQDDGSYVPNGESREVNELQKFFRAEDKMTVAEIRGAGTEAGFFDQWLDANAGKVRDRTTKGAGKTGNGRPNLPGAKAPAAAAGSAPAATTKSMFATG